ncbi:MAG: protein-L-isoaspartate O-methyltransferase [Candidatus Nanohaloarchaea archaeon]
METNDELVDYLKEQGYIETEKVEKAFRTVDRKNFVPEGSEEEAYRDHALPLEEGDSTISAPHMVAINTELLDVGENDSVLEVGSGSGYQLAILSELTSDKVTGVEIIPGLAERSARRLENHENVEVIQGEGLKAVEERFDRILYSCAVESFEDAKGHLSDEGIAVAPIQEDGRQVLKKLQDSEITEHGHVRFVPYREADERKDF